MERDFEGSFRDREAYELSQKFIQIDSTYYTGYYFEGLYRYFRASDQLGYEKASKPIRKAIELMEKDYRRELRRVTDIRQYINIYPIQQKYAILIGFLEKCYQYTGRPDKALRVLQQLAKKNFVFNFGVDPYATMAWIYHRNRTYSRTKFPFLKGSIEQNVRTASLFADSILIANRRNYRLVSQWFPGYADNPEGNYFHYKDIIYSYLLQVDSAEYCAKNLMRLDLLSKNNYGNLQFIQGKFEKAEDYYNQAREEDNYIIKSTKEFDYMESVIKVFKNELKAAQKLIHNSLSILGTTPGFGWNNIAMARAQYYSGDLESLKSYRDKAANFKELHINSTWGKLQYDRNTLLFQYLYHLRKMNDIRFRDRYYWLSLSNLMELAGHYFKKENAHLILTSELSANPERFLVLYNIFSSENTMFFDEIWEVIKTFNPEYFINLFQEKREQDTRPAVLKYYNYYIARFYLEDADYKQAIEYFESILQDPTLNQDYEKLLIARVYEGLALAYREVGKEAESFRYINMYYSTYPTLVPFSDLTMGFNLQVLNENLTPEQELFLNDLKRCRIDWMEKSDMVPWPIVQILFSETKGQAQIEYKVTVDEKSMMEGVIKQDGSNNLSQLLAFRLFKINLSSNN